MYVYRILLIHLQIIVYEYGAPGMFFGDENGLEKGGRRKAPDVPPIAPPVVCGALRALIKSKKHYVHHTSSLTCGFCTATGVI